MTTATTRSIGNFCWINILTPDVDASRDFYSKLLGWDWLEMPAVGWRMQVDGHDVGGLFDLNGPNMPPGIPPGIGVMVKVESADAAAADIARLGGKAGAPMDVFDAGRMVTGFDPSGANIDVWEPRKSPGTDADYTMHGVPSWFELTTKDVDKVIPFYTKLFGWKAEAMPMPDFTYTTMEHEGNKIAGIMPLLPAMGEMPPWWAVYFTVDDTDATAKKAKDLGGSLFVEPMDIPNVGRFAGIKSPQGVHFYVIKYVKQ